jgi:hypothetical protein
MAAGFSPFLDAVSKLTSVKLTECIFPIAKITANFTPMVTGDDVSLRTSLVSPISYDRELCKIIVKHLTIVDKEEDTKLNYNQLVSKISNIDKLSAIWALYKATYDNLADQREMTCVNNECKQKFKIDIPMDDLIHEDTYTIWDVVDAESNDVPFDIYRVIISVEHKDTVYNFKVKLPSIKNNNDLLGVVSIDTLQYNLENTGRIFSRPQHMTLLTEALQITSKSNAFSAIETTNFDELLLTFNNYLPFQVSDKFFTEYNDIFTKYSPNYYLNVTCPICGNIDKHDIDLETEFFRKCLSV